MNVHRLFTIKRVNVWMECFGGDVNRMECGIGWSGVVKLDEIGLDEVGLNSVGL